MDTPCHALTGLVMGQAIQTGTEDEHDRPGVLYMTLVSVVPDADFVLEWFGMSAYLTYHRSLNSVFLLPLVLLLFAGLYSKLGGQRSFRSYVTFGGLAVLVHLFMDLMNTFGSPLLFPLSNARFSLDLLFIVDLFVYTILLISPITWLFRGSSSPWVARGSFCLLGVYVLFCSVNHLLARNQIPRMLQERNLSSSQVLRTGVTPQPLFPFRWSIIVQHQNGSEQRFVNTITGSRFAQDVHFDRNESLMTLLREGSRYDRDATVFDRFSRYPVAVRTEERIIYADLQFHARITDSLRACVVPSCNGANASRPMPFRLQATPATGPRRASFQWIQQD